MKKKLDNLGFALFALCIVLASLYTFYPDTFAAVFDTAQALATGDFSIMPFVRSLSVIVTIALFVVGYRMSKSPSSTTAKQDKVAYTPKRHKSVVKSGMKLVR